MRRRKGPRPAIRRNRNSRNNRNSSSNNSSSILPQDENAPKRQRREVARIFNGTLTALERRVDEHDQRMKEARGKIEEVCNALREAIDGIEKHLIDTLQQGYTKEDERLHKMIHEMRELGSNILDNNNSNNNNNKGEYLNKEEEKDFSKAIKEADGILRYVQEYSVKHPECEDVGKWARDALGAVLEICVSQSLCRERLEGRTPRITSVTPIGPNEVCIDFEFPRAEEEAALRGVDNFKKVSYKVEMWNGEEGEYDVRSVQCIGPSRRVSVEWRLIGGSECKVRVRAVWRGLSGEECLSEWGEWATFTVPRKHKNSGAVRTSAAWANRAVGGETYTVVDTYSDEVIYAGSKPYAMLPQCPTGCDIVITGRRGEVTWEEVRNIENVPFVAKSFLEDLRLFHTDKEACLLALLGIAKSTELSEEGTMIFVKNGGLDTVSNTIRNNINDQLICSNGFSSIADIICNNQPNRILARESGFIELIKDAITKHVDNIEVCTNGFRLFAFIIDDNLENKRIACELGYVDFIKSVITKHKDNVDVCANGFISIAYIACDNPEGRKLTYESKCIEFIKEGVMRHFGDPIVCTGGFHGVACIADKTPDAQKLAYNLGFFKLFKDGITRHINNESVCFSGFQGFLNVSFKNLRGQDLSFNMEILKLIKIGVIKHINHNDVCRFGLGAFCNFAQYDPCVRVIAYSLGFIKLIKEVLSRHINHAGICRYGFNAIDYVVNNDPDAQKDAHKAGYVGLIKAGIMSNIDNAVLCICGFGAISKTVSHNANNQKTAYDLGLIGLIKYYIAGHIDDVDVCRYAIRAIDEIAQKPYTYDLVCESGGIKLVKDVVAKHIDNAEVCDSGFGIIEKVTLNNAPRQKLACELGFVELVFEMLSRHSDNQFFTMRGCNTLKNLLSSQETHARWYTRDVLRRIEEYGMILRETRIVKECLTCLKRVKDPRVADAVSRGVCTKENFKDCDCGRKRKRESESGSDSDSDSDSEPETDEDPYCPDCYVSQKCFRCLTCNGGKDMYCETCWKKHHQGHKCEEFFYPIKCATK